MAIRADTSPYMLYSGAPGPKPGFVPADDSLTLDEQGLKDLYPSDPSEAAALLAWCQGAFIAAERARGPFERRWYRFWKLYNSYVQRDRTDWRSKIFFPIPFSTVQTVLPRLVADLFRIVTKPRKPGSETAAELMESVLEYCSTESDLYPEAVAGMWSALCYGTGIMKAYYRLDIRRGPVKTQGAPVPTRTQQVRQPIFDPETQVPLTDLNGNPMFGVTDEPVEWGPGPEQIVWSPYVAYDGPAAEQVDIFDFFPAPEAHDIQSARYVVQRMYREMSEVLEKVERGIYRFYDGADEKYLQGITDVKNEAWAERLSRIEMGDGRDDWTRRPVELLEFHLRDGRQMTMLNRRCIIRCQANGYAHGMKPYVRLLDYPVPNQFWGTGEIETVEGSTDGYNALVNRRLDHGKLLLNPMIGLRENAIEDPRDATLRPGGIVRVTADGVPVRDVWAPLELPPVPESAFVEAQQLLAMAERVSGVTPYQIGLDTPSMNDTATGAGLMTEAGATRFGLKTRLAEIGPWRQLAKMFGSIVQQFWTETQYVQILGQTGEYEFLTISPGDLAGDITYDIQVSSAAQTAQQRRRDAIAKWETLGPALQGTSGYVRLIIDVLRAYDEKDLQAYVGELGDPMFQLMQAAQSHPEIMAVLQQMSGAGAPGAPPAEGAPAAGAPGEAAVPTQQPSLPPAFQPIAPQLRLQGPGA